MLVSNRTSVLLAAHRTAHAVSSTIGVPAAKQSDGEGPGIITERDLLHSSGRGEDVDKELVRDHLAGKLIYAYADRSLEQAAEAMTHGGFRHVIVLEGGDAVGVLSMRDIVRCWLTEGASCDVAPQGAT